MKKLLTIITFALSATVAKAQITGYVRTPLSNQTYASIQNGTVINSDSQIPYSPSGSTPDNDGGLYVSLPFNFFFDGTYYNSVTWCTNGWLALGSTHSGVITSTTTRGNISADLFTTNNPNLVIAPWFGDINANWNNGAPGKMVHGSVGYDIYAFEWYKASGDGSNNSSTNLITFMVKLWGPGSGAPGRIDFLYDTATATPAIATSAGAGWTIGLKDVTGGSGHFLNALNGSNTTTSVVSGWPGIGNGYRFDPPVPTIVTHPVSTAVCPSGNATFTIVSTNTFQYDWHYSTDGGANFHAVIDGGVYSGATTNTLTITGATAAMNGYIYRCSPVSGTRYVNSNTATLTIHTLPTVTTNPVNVTVCTGSNTSFTAGGTGAGLTYQWQVNTGSGFTNISNGGVYSGAATSTLNITGATISMNGYQYRCVLSGTCAPAVNTTPADLTVNSYASVTTHPRDTTICPGTDANFTVTATGSGTISYQWYEYTPSTNWTLLSNNATYQNVNTPTLSITGATTSMDGNFYTCIISGSACPSNVNSNVAQLNVNSMVYFNTQPTNTAVCDGAPASFSLTAWATSYQWEESTDGGTTWNTLSNTSQYSGVTTNQLSIASAPITMNGYKYRCILANVCSGPNSSSVVTLTVHGLPAITAHPTDSTSCDGLSMTTNVTFSVKATGAGLTYQWQVNTGSGFTDITVPNAGYYNFNSDTLLISNPTPGMNGYSYRCIVSGTCAPSVTSNAAVLTVNTRPRITAQPNNSLICNGSDASFTIGAVATGISYQWQEWNGTTYIDLANTGPYSGVTTNTLTVSAPTISQNNANKYRCVISGTACGPTVASHDVYHFVSGPAIVTTELKDLAACSGGGSFSFYVGATAVTPSGNANYRWQESTDNGATWTDVTNTPPYSAVTTDHLTITGATPTMQGYLYRSIVSSGCNPDDTSVSAKLDIIYPPVITSQPSNSTVCPGISASFTTAASGTNLLYQWQIDIGTGFSDIPSGSADYIGEKTATLTIPSPKTSMNNYQFRCIVSGECPPALTTINAVLKVHNPVTIASHTISETACEFSEKKIGVNAAGSALIYQWQLQTSPGVYTDLQNVPPYSGVYRDSLRISNISASLNGNVYRCLVTENLLCNMNFYTADIPFAVTPAPVSTPENLTVPNLGTAVFTVPNTGTAYQWQENAGGLGFADITDPSRYQGMRTNTLTIPVVDKTMTGYEYRCIVDGVCVSPVTSKSSILIVDGPLAIANMKGLNADLRVYPNPLQGNKLNISFNSVQTGVTEVRVLDKLGKLVYKGILNIDQRNSANIDLGSLAPGAYLLQVIGASGNLKQVVPFSKQ